MSNENPSDLKYTKTHEWVRDNGDGSVTIGITEHAQELKRNSEGVAESAQTANQVASHAMELAQQQSGLVDDFSQAMLSMKDQVNSSSQQVSEIQSKLQQQMLQVRQSLGLS
mgnify:CR=1 FL=1